MAKNFSNRYMEFELPNGWKCALEGSEYVCQSENADRQKEAIIILAAKIRGQQDDLDQYTAYLKKPKTYQLPGGKVQNSEHKSTKKRVIGKQEWVDSFHLASEVPGFYTRYLATVKADLGVAITFSVTKSMYSVYQDIFEKIIKSMKVFRQTKSNAAGGLALNAGTKDVGSSIDDSDIYNPDDSMNGAFKRKKKKNTSGGGDNSLIFIIAGVAVGGFLLLKMGKKKPKKKKGKSGKKKNS